MLVVENLLAKDIGLLVRKLRAERGLSQEHFASQCGLHRTYVGLIERGQKNITVETTLKITSALELSLSQFFNLLEDMQSLKNPHE